MTDTVYSEDESLLDAAQPADGNDVAALIARGLRELGDLKRQVSDAEAIVAHARGQAEEQLSVVKAQANEEVTQAKLRAREALAQVKAQNEADLAQARANAQVIVDEAASEINQDVNTASAAANEVRARYVAHINLLIQTGWATPGALASLGHSVPRSGGRKPSK